MSYAFTTTLLSAQKYSSPPQIGLALSGSGVNIITLSTNDVGISFTPVTPLSSSLVEVTVDGSKFSIDIAYAGSNFGVVKVPVNNVKTFTIFTFNPIKTSYGVVKDVTTDISQTSLSTYGISVLSVANAGNIAFNTVTPTGVPININVGGNNFRVDTAFHLNEVALINGSTYTFYTLTTALSVQPLSGTLSIGEADVVDGESRRKWLYGYI